MDRHWIDTLRELLVRGLPVVRMAVAAVRGSAPREPGATLLYWRDEAGQVHADGSIGGGHLEFRALEIARSLLGETSLGGNGSGHAGSTGSSMGSTNGNVVARSERFTLGATLGQCCGGVVELYWERFDHVEQAEALAAIRSSGQWRWSRLDAPEAAVAGGDPRFLAPAGIATRGAHRYFVERLDDDLTELYLYGAGHVGKALVNVLSGLPFRLYWTDSRPGMGEGMAMPVHENDAPEQVAAQAPGHAWHLVMTHSHDEDFRICEALVAKNRFGFLGVIGSDTKQARFRSRLLQRGHDAAAVGRMQSPIGIAGIGAKLPAAIAVAVAAQLLQLREAGAQAARDQGARTTITGQHDKARGARNA